MRKLLLLVAVALRCAGAAPFDAKRGEVYVFNHSGNSATVIEAKNAGVVATIPLGGSPEFAAVDAETGRIYINLEDKSEVVEIDTAKHEVVARWPLAPGEEPTGIALDAAHHRLFTACHNKNDDDARHQEWEGRRDGSDRQRGGWMAFDDATQLVFASCGEGVAT